MTTKKRLKFVHPVFPAVAGWLGSFLILLRQTEKRTYSAAAKLLNPKNRPFLRPSLLESQKVIRKLVENGQKANRPFSRPEMAFQSAFKKRIGLFKAYSLKIVEFST